MIDSDEAKRLSSREDALADDVKRRDSDPPLGSPSLLAVTTTFKTYPTTSLSFHACLPLTLLGTEVEGGPGSVSPGDAIFFALNIGASVPPNGTQVLTTFVGNRWIFRFDA